MKYQGVFVKSQYNGKVVVHDALTPFWMQNSNAPRTAKKNFLKQIQRLKAERALEDDLIAERLAWEKSKENPWKDQPCVVVES